MRALAFFAVVVIGVIVGVMFTLSHRRSPQDARLDVLQPEASPPVQAAGVRRWVEAGLISEEQARAIDAYEDAQRMARPRPRFSPAMEALAYTGGILLAVGAGMIVGQYWDQLTVGGRVGVMAIAAVVTGVVGAVVGEGEAVTWRLRGFLWALSSAATAIAAALFAREVLDLKGEPVALIAFGAGTIEAACLWWLRDRPLQHAFTFIGLAVSIGVTIRWAGGWGGAIGLAIWLLGAMWAGLAWRQRVPPAVVGFLLGSVSTLVACGIMSSQSAWQWFAPLLGLATALAWVGAGVVAEESLVLAPGVAGVFVFLPWTLGYYFGGTLGAPAVAMASGAALLALVVLLVRRGRGDDSAHRRVHPRHFHRIAHP